MSSPTDTRRTILAVGAHPDDIEFGCGGVLLKAAKAGFTIHLLVCTKGEASSRGTPVEREHECRAAAERLGGHLRFIALEGDAHLTPSVEGSIAIARIIRECQPAFLIGPTDVANQHPDHVAVAGLVRNAARFARYGGLEDLNPLPPHRVDQLLCYAVTPAAEPTGRKGGVLFDISSVRDEWEELMKCHQSQLETLPYIDLQISRARTWGLEAGVAFAQALFPNDPLVFDGLEDLSRSARAF